MADFGDAPVLDSVPYGSPKITEIEWFEPDELPEGIRDRELMQDILRGDSEKPNTPLED